MVSMAHKPNDLGDKAIENVLIQCLCPCSKKCDLKSTLLRQACSFTGFPEKHANVGKV
jgi:hypothetical protein